MLKSIVVLVALFLCGLPPDYILRKRAGGHTRSPHNNYLGSRTFTPQGTGDFVS